VTGAKMQKSAGIRPELFLTPITALRGLTGEIMTTLEKISKEYHSPSITSVQLNLCNISLGRAKISLDKIAFNLLSAEHVEESKCGWDEAWKAHEKLAIEVAGSKKETARKIDEMNRDCCWD
jgi:hypothetical protein